MNNLPVPHDCRNCPHCYKTPDHYIIRCCHEQGRHDNEMYMLEEKWLNSPRGTIFFAGCPLEKGEEQCAY